MYSKSSYLYNLYRFQCFFFCTYKLKLSLNFGDQLLFLDLVWNLRFLLLRWGPIMVISTKGRNMPDVCHFKSLAPTTKCVKKTHAHREEEDDIMRWHLAKNATYLASCYEDSNRPLTVTLRSPFPGWVCSSIWTDTSPIDLSTPEPEPKYINELTFGPIK